MDDHTYLEHYDPTVFARPSVTVDLILMSVIEGGPAVLLTRRDRPPYRGHWALPGGFVGTEESLDAAARRILRDKAHLEEAYVEQLYTFGAVDRDPRMRVISIAYFALLPADRLQTALRQAPDLKLASIDAPPSVDPRSATNVALRIDGAEPLTPAFDHATMIGVALERLRGKLDYSDIAFALLPERFTLRRLQEVYEAILGRRLNKPAFRRRMLDRGWLVATGEREVGASFRPAELYQARHRGAGD